jgi:hypothetical protein
MKDHLKKSHKALTPSVRDSFIKKISYAIKQNINTSADDMRAALQAIIPHMYGNHSSCIHGVNL